MKLTKFVHACVLVEDENHTALFDPGQFAWESGLVKLESLSKLDYVLITHEHFDHFFKPFVAAIIQMFPEAQFISTPSVCEQLTEMGAKKVTTESDEFVNVAALNHDGMAPLGSNPPCENVRFHYKSFISHPGDSIHMTESRDVLFLPLAGPWEASVDAVAFGQDLKPKIIIPIHDWMWNDEWRASMYDRLEAFYVGMGINFVKTVDGQEVEL